MAACICCKCGKPFKPVDCITWCGRIYCKDCEPEYTTADKAKEEAQCR